jgi:Tfp pilus assembly protein PilN
LCARQKIFERIALPVLRSVDHIGRSRAHKPVGRVLLAPVAEELGLFAALAEQLPMPVEQLDLGQHFDCSRTPELREPAGQSRALVALGAALRSGQVAQMNLLMRPKQPMGMALWALGLMAVVLVGLAGYAWQLRAGVQSQQAELDQGVQQLAQVKNEIEAIRQREGTDAEVEALNKQVADLKPRAEGVKSLVDSLRTASLGRPEGYSDYLERLARISDPELWVTSVAVLDGGRRVEITGRALRNEAVVRYAKRLNESFEPLGVKFNALEMTPEFPAQTKGAVVGGTINFRLS